jgi:hypothetical protein
MAARKTKPGRRKLRPVTDAEIDAVLPDTLLPPPPAAAAVSPLHEMFNSQVRAVLETSDLTDEEKQTILVTLNCPCCGGSGGGLTYKLRSRT